MIECLILGDSIAVGIAQHRTECIAYATVGITSRKFVKDHINGDLSADTVIISLGSNDSENMATLKELFALRQVVKAKKVVWVLPSNKPSKTEAVEIVADKFEDRTVKTSMVSKDGVHPTAKGYRQLSELTR